MIMETFQQILSILKSCSRHRPDPGFGITVRFTDAITTTAAGRQPRADLFLRSLG